MKVCPLLTSGAAGRAGDQRAAAAILVCSTATSTELKGGWVGRAKMFV